MVSHSSVPTPEHIRDGLFRIYFSPRDEFGRSNVSYLVVDLNDPTRVIDLCDAPCLEPGALGTFDDSGAMVSCIVRQGDRRWLYYTGWNVGGRAPWRTSIGLAHYEAESQEPVFERVALGPILDRSVCDPYFAMSPCVIVEDGRWRMWYLSGMGWQESPAGPLPRYQVVHAQSADGIHWDANGHVCIAHAHPGEVAIGRPCVLRENGVYKMWYSFRGDEFGYRMGYAESADGLAWRRRDELVDLPRSNSGWDSEATAYPAVFDHGGRRFMLYCGNGYSKAGFGLAVLS
jgi:predicted GH43/DUF377 family glycosyl hydrolase